MDANLFAEPVAMLRNSISVISHNLSYIRQHLPELELPQDLQQRVLSVCWSFEDALQDVNSEVGNLEAFLEQRSGCEPGETRQRIRRRLKDETDKMDGLVTSLWEQPSGDHHITGLKILVNESAGNILCACISIRDSLEVVAARLKQCGTEQDRR